MKNLHSVIIYVYMLLFFISLLFCGENKKVYFISSLLNTYNFLSTPYLHSLLSISHVPNKELVFCFNLQAFLLYSERPPWVFLLLSMI